jgi:hypothetical protein
LVTVHRLSVLQPIRYTLPTEYISNYRRLAYTIGRDSLQTLLVMAGAVSFRHFQGSPPGSIANFEFSPPSGGKSPKLNPWVRPRQFLVTYQRNKARCHKPYGLLQPLPIPEKPWHTVTFDIIVKLSKTSRVNDSVCVFADKLTKMVHFVACKEALSAKEFAELYVDHVFRLHGPSREFITDRDTRFMSAFWKGVTELLGTRTVMPSSFHPQSDDHGVRRKEPLIKLWERTCNIMSLLNLMIVILCCHVQSLPIMQRTTSPSV